jgi:succinate dehydrogenase / fumarate reductase cytochrome b subunit
LHRVSGVALFLALPVSIYLLAHSLRDESGFAEVSTMLASASGRLLLLGVIAALAHHVFAGLRHLALDIHWGVAKQAARRSAGGVMIVTGAVTLAAAWGLFK